MKKLLLGMVLVVATLSSTTAYSATGFGFVNSSHYGACGSSDFC